MNLYTTLSLYIPLPKAVGLIHDYLGRRQKPTTVVRMKRSGGKVVQDCDVYIGRACHYGGWNLQESIWHNPFTVAKYGRDQVLRLYEERVRNSPFLMSKIHELRGKRLGCWCKPLPCHGDILVNIADSLDRDHGDGKGGGLTRRGEKRPRPSSPVSKPS